MNPHYHGYSDMPSPHSPPPDNNNYGHIPMSNGHMGMGGPHHVHHHSPYLHQHHLSNANNNNNSNASSNNNNNNSCGGGGGGTSAKLCGGCGNKIVERFLLHALDRYWHNGCLKCTCCGAMLADIGSSCFTKGGMILCKTDYVRLFGNTGACSACGQTIPASEFVMRAGAAGGPGGPGPQPHHVFHLKCFACSKCGAQLVPGDRYYLLAGSLVCEQDWHKLLKSTAVGATGTTPPVRKGKVGRPRRSRD